MQPEPTPFDLQMMELALDQARRAADVGEVPVGAVIYQLPDQRVLAQAHNLRETASDPTAHAEMLALRTAAGVLGSWRLESCSMAVTLEPCPMCAGALVNARVQRLIYGAADPKMGAVATLYQICGDTRLNHQVQLIGPVLADRCGQLLKAFFQERRSPHRVPKPRPDRPRDDSRD